MRTRPALASPLSPKVRFAFTDHPITVWAGAILLRLYFELIGLRATLTPVLTPFTKTSNNQIPSLDVRFAWWCGCRSPRCGRFCWAIRWMWTRPSSVGMGSRPAA